MELPNNFDNMFKGIYGWSVSGDEVIAPVHKFPREVKERADYFSEMMDDGMTFLGCLDCIFSDEKPKYYNWAATKPWIDKSPEFKEWEDEIGTDREMAIYLLFPFWEEK